MNIINVYLNNQCTAIFFNVHCLMFIGCVDLSLSFQRKPKLFQPFRGETNIIEPSIDEFFNFMGRVYVTAINWK